MPARDIHSKIGRIGHFGTKTAQLGYKVGDVGLDFSDSAVVVGLGKLHFAQVENSGLAYFV